MADTTLYQDVICDEVTFDSADGRSTIHACVWRPEGLPERDGLPAEKVLRNILRATILTPRVRPYRTDNFYYYLHKQGKEAPKIAQGKNSTARKKK